MTVTRLAFKLEEGNNQIDLAKSMSTVMRTLIRQKQTFTVLGGQVVDNANGTVKISTAPNTWYVRAAINRGFKAWKQMRHVTLDNAGLEDDPGQKVGKFADFKITLNGTATTVPPIYGGNVLAELAAPQEWNYADIKPEQGASKALKILGPHSPAYYSLTNGWIQSRPIPNVVNEPTMPDLDGDGALDYLTDFLATLHDTDDGQSERLGLVYEENDHAPFAVNDIYGDMSVSNNLQLQSLTYTSTTNPHHMIAGFKALCGLIQVHVDGGTNPILFLDVLNTPERF